MINSFEGQYDFLSNFYPSQIEYEGIIYPTVEHAFQAAKTTDVKTRKLIAAMPTPGQAKRAGRSVSLRPDWEDIKFSVMASCLEKKFEIPELRIKLLETGNQYLEEGNTWHDKVWGVCHCDKCGCLGLNHLGYMLMQLRSGIKVKTLYAKEN